MALTLKKINKPTTATVAALQMTSLSEVADNLTVIERMLARTQESVSIDLLVLPENFACMAMKPSQYWDIAESDGIGKIQMWLSELAQRHALFIVAGSVPLKPIETPLNRPNRVFSACLVYSPRGKRLLRYNKTHLFDAQVAQGENYRESATFIHGELNQKNTFKTPWGDVAVSICYDVRFPELYRRVPESVVLHCIPAAFTKTTGKAHWQTLLMARAIENQTYILGAGQVGRHDNQRETWGHSMLIDPWGKKLAEIKQTSGLLSARINVEELQKIRRGFPCLSHKRL